MKKIRSLVFVIVIMAIIATGCGGSFDKGMNSGTQTPSDTASANKNVDVNNDGYIVMVTDPDDAPVVGARVQFCSASTCYVGKTDDTGCAVFKQEPGAYTVHILSAKGYVVTDEEYVVPEDYGIVKVVLQKE